MKERDITGSRIAGVTLLCFFVAIVGLVIYIKWTWIDVRDEALRSQRALDSVFSTRSIDGYALTIFYDERVKFHSDSMTIQDAMELVPILKTSSWIRLADFTATNLSKEEISEVRVALAPILVVGRDLQTEVLK